MMKKQTLILLTLIIITFSACLDSTSMYEQVTVLKTPLQRVLDLNKSDIDIKKSEEKEALVRQENDYLEYEYPIQEDESYVVGFRFDRDGCFEIILDTYFNKQTDAENVITGILEDLKLTYGQPLKEEEHYFWEKEGVKIELDKHNVERGMITLTIYAIE
jgi:hypothetical protein